MADVPYPAEEIPVVAVVDDDPAIRLATARVCRQMGLDVREAENGRDAVALIRRTVPDLVLLDVDLGDMDGREICRTLRGEPELARTLFVMVSAAAVREQDRVYGLEIGADGYITRPISNDELRAWIRAYLRIQVAERTRRTAENALERAGRLSALATLAGGVGHEISNPLMGILGYATLIQEGTQDKPEIAGFAEEIANESHRIEAIIASMRRIGSVAAEHEPEHVPLLELMNELVRLLGNEYREHDQIEIDVSDTDERGCHIPRADGLYVLTLLASVCRRAILKRSEARADTRTIRLSAKKGRSPNTTGIEIADNSDGMPERACAHAFDPFFVREDRIQEDGLDLAMAYRITKSMGGDLAIKSNSKDGTTFLLTFPSTGANARGNP